MKAARCVFQWKKNTTIWRIKLLARKLEICSTNSGKCLEIQFYRKLDVVEHFWGAKNSWTRFTTNSSQLPTRLWRLISTIKPITSILQISNLSEVALWIKTSAKITIFRKTRLFWLTKKKLTKSNEFLWSCDNKLKNPVFENDDSLMFLNQNYF